MIETARSALSSKIWVPRVTGKTACPIEREFNQVHFYADATEKLQSILGSRNRSFGYKKYFVLRISNESSNHDNLWLDSKVGSLSFFERCFWDFSFDSSRFLKVSSSRMGWWSVWEDYLMATPLDDLGISSMFHLNVPFHSIVWILNCLFSSSSIKHRIITDNIYNIYSMQHKLCINHCLFIFRHWDWVKRDEINWIIMDIWFMSKVSITWAWSMDGFGRWIRNIYHKFG